jgi:lipid-A-disaccharide synthase
MPNLKLKPFIVTPPHLIPLVQKLCPHAFPLHTPIIPSTQRHLLFARSHAALTASGTASLELSVAKIPTVIAYTLHPIIGLAASLLAPLFIHTSHVGILNILAIHLHKQPPIPEFIQQQCSPKKLAHALKILIEEPSSQISQTQKLIPHLLKNQNQPATVAAQHILPLIPTTQKHTP